MDVDAGAGCGCSGVERGDAVVVGFAVADQDDRAAAFEQSGGRLDGGGRVGAGRDEGFARAEGAEDGFGRVDVAGEGEADVGIAGEDDEGGAAAAAGVEQGQGLVAGARPAAGRDVAGGHALRDVDGDDEVGGGGDRFGFGGAELRARGGDGDKGDGGEEERVADSGAAAPAGRDGAAAVASDGDHGEAALAPAPVEREAGQRDGREQCQHFGRAERDHGTVLSGPARRPASASSSSAAASSSQGASSRMRSSSSTPRKSRSRRSISS